MTSTRTPQYSSTRSWPVPRGGQTIHLVGDLHYGDGVTFANNRRAKLETDLISGAVLPEPLARVLVGDLVNDGLASQDASVLAFLDAIGPVPWYATCGNHDIWNNARTPDEWAAAFDLPGGVANYTVEIAPGLRLIAVSPDSLTADNTTMDLSADTIAWLDSTLSSHASDACIIVSHAPLAETVLGDPNLYYTTDLAFYTAFSLNGGNDSVIREVLADNNNAKAIASGHTHSPLFAPGLITAVTVGSRQIAQINAGAIAYQGKVYSLDNTTITPYLTYYGDFFEVRWRDSGAGGIYNGPDGIRVTRVDVS